MRPLLLKCAKCVAAILIALGPLVGYCLYLHRTAPLGGEDVFGRSAVLLTYSLRSLWFSILPVYLAENVGIFLFLRTVCRSVDVAVLATVTSLLSVLLTLSAMTTIALTDFW